MPAVVVRKAAGRGSSRRSSALRNAWRCLAWLSAGAVGTVAWPACSSSTSNEGTGGAGGGAGGGPVSCADAGADCGGCCAAAVGPVTMQFFDTMVQKCACDSTPPTVCAAECGDYCSTQTLSVKCVGCLLGPGGNCVTNQCTAPGCKQVVDCLKTCK